MPNQASGLKLPPTPVFSDNGCAVPSLSQISTLVRQAASDAGFDLAGMAAVEDFPELAHFPGWVESGRAGEMDYLKKKDQQGRLQRASLQNAVPWARSVIVCAMNYNTARPFSTDCNQSDRGWISRYAWSDQDYHDAILRRLRQVEDSLRKFASDPELRTRCYVDTGPIVERVYAKYAGIGWIGKNTCIINQQLGSWLFLGVILTSLPLASGLPAADRCGTCTRCLDACPTGALVAPYQMDSNLCIAYLTIEKRGPIPETLRAGVGRHVFGCDICQDVCPWNRSPNKAQPAAAPEFQARAELVNPALDWLAALSPEDFRAAFRHSPVKRAKYSGLRRNVAVAMGNSGNPQFIPRLQALASDPDKTVAEHARWALTQLSGS